MSDGFGQFPEKEMLYMSENLDKYIFRFWTIGFGALTDDTFKLLSKMNAEVRGRFKNPITFK